MALTRVINSGIGVAGSIAGEGTATTDLQQGLAKFFFNLNGETFALTSSTFNISTATDEGTGQHNCSITNNMSDGLYPATGIAGDPASKLLFVHIQTLSSKTSSTFHFRVYYVANTTGGGSYADAEYIYVDGHGDLA